MTAESEQNPKNPITDESGSVPNNQTIEFLRTVARNGITVGTMHLGKALVERDKKRGGSALGVLAIAAIATAAEKQIKKNDSRK